MDKKEILKFADILKWEFFTRLKDETAPAHKEFSYVDLLSIVDIAYKQIGISKADREEYDKTKPNNHDILLAALPPEMANTLPTSDRLSPNA